MDASWHRTVHGKQGRCPTHPSPWVIADGRAVQGGSAQVLQDMSTDPKAAAEHQRNPTIMAKIQKLINAGIVQVR